MTNIYKQAEKDGIRIVIIHDNDVDSPRDSCDNLGTMVCWHRKYLLGDEQPKINAEDYLEEMDQEKMIMLPLHLYDHSGITMSTGQFACRWDSGQVGFIFVTHEDIEKEFGKVNDETIEKAKAILKAEVKYYDLYLRGECYGFRLEKSNLCKECGVTTWEEIDSCYGFITDNPEKDIAENIPEEYKFILKEL